MSYIESWDKVPDGAIVVEDTYNEKYEVFTRDGQRWLRQIGWQIPHTTAPLPEVRERLIDFDPNSPYDQPWIRLG